MVGPGETVRLLADRIRAMETSFRLSKPTTIPLGGCGLGDLFPSGELPAGSLLELMPSVPGAGAWTLALLIARHACGERKALLIADPERCFYPPAARKFGIETDRTIIARPRTAQEALLAVAQALRCSAIGTVIGTFERLADRDSRRLQLAAESGGAVGVLVRPVSEKGSPSFASIRLLLDPLPSARGRRRLRLEVLRCRGGHEGKTTGMEIDDATGHVRAFPLLELAEESASTA
jgi:protein ImuA